jgi:hypothetical protein
MDRYAKASMALYLLGLLLTQASAGGFFGSAFSGQVSPLPPLSFS